MRPVLVAAALVAATVGAVEAAHGSPQSTPPSVVFLKPGYTTPSRVQRVLIRNGVMLGGRVRPVLTARCDGVGRRKHGAELGWIYHQFACAVSTRYDRLAHAKVLWWADDTYRYDFFGCRAGRGCS